MKKFIFLFLSVFLFFPALSNADPFFGISGSYIPEQSVSATGVQGKSTFDMNNSFGASGEMGYYTPSGLLSFGVEAGFQNLTAFDPISGSGVQSVSADVFSIMGKTCGYMQNHGKITPYACGGMGMYNINPSVTLGAGNGVKTNLLSVFTSGYMAEVGIQMKASKDFSVFGAGTWQDTFLDPVVSIPGAPATSQQLDIGRFGIKAGVRF